MGQRYNIRAFLSMLMGVGSALTFIVVWPALVLGIASLYLALTSKAQMRSGR